MKKQCFALAVWLASMATGMPAQAQTGTVNKGGTITVTTTTNGVVQSFTSQQADSLGTYVFVNSVGRGGQGVTGSPVSAREENRTVQTLSDGTQIETSEVSQFYRDNQGRTRTERTVDGVTNIQILDPVASQRITLDPKAKSATSVSVPAMMAGRGGTAAVTRAAPAKQAQTDGSTLYQNLVVGLEPRIAAATTNPQLKREDLGFQMQNGVMAQGTRVTRTILAGTIGNNRDIQVVNEQWYSKDLQMMVKTVNSDPRYGTTTYEMTSISQATPDAGLFMIPAGYTITEQAGRGAMKMTPLSGGGR
jgi:hypothetical protein